MIRRTFLRLGTWINIILFDLRIWLHRNLNLEKTKKFIKMSQIILDVVTMIVISIVISWFFLIFGLNIRTVTVGFLLLNSFWNTLAIVIDRFRELMTRE